MRRAWPGSLLARLLVVVTWPHWSDHWLRTALTALGVSLGVATVTAVTDINASILASFRHMVEAVAGASELEVTSPTGDVDEALVASVAVVPGVAAAAGIVETFLPLATAPEESVYLLGLDFLGSPVWEPQLPRETIEIADEIEFVTHLDSVIVTRKLAERVGIGEGGELRVITPAGERRLVVRGILGDAPPARLFDGMVAVMDLPAAQLLLGRRERLDRIAVEVASGERPAEVRERLAGALGPAVEVLASEARGQQSEELLFALRAMLFSGGALAVIVAAFIVYHSVSVSVRQRRHELALLNAVGVGQGTLMRLCLLETTALAGVGLLLGLGTGRALATLASGSVGRAASEVWLRIDASQHAHPGGAVGAGIAVGVATALVTAYLAIRLAFRTPTIEALRPAGLEAEDRRGLTASLVGALLLAGVTWPTVWAAPPGIGFTALVALIVVTHAAVYFAGAFAAPAAVAGAGEGGERLLRSSSSVPLRLAVENLRRSPRRGGAVVATVGVGLGMVVQFTGLVQSFDAAWTHWIQQHFGADLFVGSGGRVRLMAGPEMSADVAAKLADIPGVESVEPFRVVPIRLGTRSVFLEGLSLDDRLARGGLAMVEGDLPAAAGALRAGTAVLVSDNLAFRLGLHRGDALTLPTPRGPRRFEVAGTFVDYLAALDRGAVAVAYEQLRAIWDDSSANLLRLWLEPGAAVSTVRREALARLGPGFYAITGRQFLEAIQAVLRTLFAATWALVFIAAVVGVIGVVNAQLATVLDRETEIATLRAVGVSKRDIALSVLAECGALGILGGLGGLAMGAMLARQMVTVDLTLVTGWRIPFTLALSPLLAGVAGCGLVSALAGWVPARAGARLGAWQRSVD